MPRSVQILLLEACTLRYQSLQPGTRDGHDLKLLSQSIMETGEDLKGILLVSWLMMIVGSWFPMGPRRYLPGAVVGMEINGCRGYRG